MNLRLPRHWRVYFWLRLRVIRTLRAAIALAVFLRWPWAVFQLMALQDKLGLRFHR